MLTLSSLRLQLLQGTILWIFEPKGSSNKMLGIYTYVSFARNRKNAFTLMFELIHFVRNMEHEKNFFYCYLLYFMSNSFTHISLNALFCVKTVPYAGEALHVMLTCLQSLVRVHAMSSTE